MIQKFIDQVELHKLINQHFDLSEIEDICYLLGISYEDLKGSTKNEKIWGLIGECRKNNRRRDLVAELKTLRPKVPWEEKVIIQLDPNEIERKYNYNDLKKIILQELELYLDNFPGSTTLDKINALIKHSEKTNQLRKLETILKQKIPPPTPFPENGCSGQIGRLKWAVLFIMPLLVVGIFAYYQFSQNEDKQNMQATLIANEIEQTATSNALENQVQLTRIALEFQTNQLTRVVPD